METTENPEEELMPSVRVPSEDDSSLDALINEEQTYVRQRLQKELGREPTQEEADRWLSEQTEGY